MQPRNALLRTRVLCLCGMLCLCGLLFSACVGRPVVGERGPDDDKRGGQCDDDELNCSDWPDADEFPELGDDTFAHDPPCEGEHMEITAIDEELLELNDLDLRCGTLELTVGNESRVDINQPRIEDARIVVHAEGAGIVTILAAEGDGATIEAGRGSSNLRLRGLANVSGLRIDASGEALGWDLDIDDSALFALQARTGRSGQLVVRGSQLERAILVGGQVSLQTLDLRDSIVDATELVASGTDVSGSVLRARRGAFATGSMDDVTMQGCESFLIRQSAVNLADLGACAAAPLELRNTTVQESIIRGRSFALQSRISFSIIGKELGASLSLFDSRVVSSVLCSVDALAARGNTVLACARCAPASPRATCIDESTSIAVVACPEVATAKTCDEDLPEALRDDPGSGFSSETDGGIGDTLGDSDPAAPADAADAAMPVADPRVIE